MVAVARAAGLLLTWDNFSDLSDIVPLLARIYPNGPADINSFQAAGGVPLLLAKLAERGLLHLDATPVFGSMQDYLCQPLLEGDTLSWTSLADSRDPAVIAAGQAVFSPSGGLKLLSGNLGRAVIKVSAVKPDYLQIEAPARVFDTQQAVVAAYQAGEFTDDVVIVVRFNGPAANGMPELHQLMPLLGNLQAAGHQVALVTDGRLSGASGKVPAAIHVTPEASKGGPLARLRDGDRLRLDAVNGRLEVLAAVDHRPLAKADLHSQHYGLGRELFGAYRALVSGADSGASLFTVALSQPNDIYSTN
jgi:phosphogluconate dehydratase